MPGIVSRMATALADANLTLDCVLDPDDVQPDERAEIRRTAEEARRILYDSGIRQLDARDPTSKFSQAVTMYNDYVDRVAREFPEVHVFRYVRVK